MPVKKTTYQVGEQVLYRALDGQDYLGTVVKIESHVSGDSIYRIKFDDFRGKGPASITSYEHHISPAQKELFAARMPRFQVGDPVEYIGDTNDGVWVITRAKYRPQKKMWIYWIRPRDTVDKYVPSIGMSVWEHDLFPIQRSFKLNSAAKVRKPAFSKGDVVVFRDSPNLSGTIVDVHKMGKSYQYSVKYVIDGREYVHAYHAHSLLPGQQEIEFKADPKFEIGEWVKTYQGGGEVVDKRWDKSWAHEGRWEYKVKLGQPGFQGAAYWYAEKAMEPLDRPADSPPEKPTEQKCRCDGTPMGNSDHCPLCGCEEYEERCEKLKSGALSKKQANWIEKSRDMYRFEQKPIGKDRKLVIGPERPEVKNTFLELPISKEAKSKPQYLQGDMVNVPMGGSVGVAPGRVSSYFWSNEHQAYFYRILLGNPGEEHEIGLWEIQLRPAQQRLFAMKINAGEVLKFDPSKRKIKTGPGTGVQEFALNDEMQEERDAVFYEYDNTIINLKELYQNMMALGETEIANNIRAALQSLTGKLLGRDI